MAERLESSLGIELIKNFWHWRLGDFGLLQAQLGGME